ncbi:MAG: DNA alkylation repair protein [Clostridia bacterium]|nr:DNA alkylation repair protein [Clostridia bacterium]
MSENRQMLLHFLFSSSEETYKSFMQKIIKNIERDKIIGVRTDKLKTYAKKIENTDFADDFLTSLPHKYFEENQIHIFLLNLIKEPNLLFDKLEEFLPYIDNWATCDGLRPKIFNKIDEKILLSKIEKYINSKEIYIQRFAIGLLNSYFTKDKFDREYLFLALSAKSEDYYVKMMKAWFFTTALSYHYLTVKEFLEKNIDDEEIFNMTVQKILDSRCFSKLQKEEIRKLKIKRRKK